MVLDAASVQQSIINLQGALKIITALHLTSFRYPSQSCVYDGQSFDYIIVGAGTAGCVLASRLADDRNSVLLIESGADPRFESDLPALLLFLKSSDASWNYTIQDRGKCFESHKETNDDMSLGRSLGGSSASSYQLYSSGNRIDYNDWAKLTNDTTWKWKNVLPFLKKSQRLEDDILLKTDREFYGRHGNIGLSLLRNAGNIKSKPYLDTFRETGRKIVPSVNGNTTLGYTYAIFTLSNSVRQNTALNYLKKQRNLYILKHALVKRVIFDCYKNAVGVEIVTGNNRFIIAKARKEVIISAGAVNTPKLLMLSGIGRRKHLCKHKIHTISDLPVGEGLQDHLGVVMVYNMSNKVVPYRPFNPYKYPATVLVGYVALNKSDEYPDYQSYTYVSYTSDQMRYCAFTYFYVDPICNSMFSASKTTEMMHSLINKQKYKSRGRILLRSSNYRDDPLIYTKYFDDKEDLEDYARILQDFARIEDTDSFKKLGGEFKVPTLPKCSKYNRDDLEYWKCYALYMVNSQHQYTSTCAMGSVVDSRLRVYGVKRLRVVDASIMPNPTAGGTLGSTIMIAEKAADFIKNKDNT